jgi:Spy/CpxP family protein refolding chaperone
MRGFFGSELNLTDDQRTQMKDVAEKAETTIRPLREQQRA